MRAHHRSTMRRTLVLAAAFGAAAVLLAACGAVSERSSSSPTATTPVPASPATSLSPSTSPPAMRTQSLYFLRAGMLGVAERTVALTITPATAAVTALLAGPTAAERAAGLASAIPAGVSLKSLSLSGGTATVDVSRAFWQDPSVAAQPAAAEIVYTLTRFATIKAVRIRAGAVPYDVAGASPSPAATLQRKDFRALEPAIFVESPGVGAALPDPFVLAGTASVFEGTFAALLTDDSGRRVVRVTVQATRGAPERGSFRQTVVYSTSAKHGVLTVFDQSMEDGSRIDVVRIPVSLSP